MNGDYEYKGEMMKKYLEQVRRRVNDLQTKIIQIPRGENKQANRLAKATSMGHMITKFHRYVGDRFCRRLDHTISLLLEKWHITRWKGGHKKAEGPSSAIHFNKSRLIQKRFLPPIPKVFVS